MSAYDYYEADEDEDDLFVPEVVPDTRLSQYHKRLRTADTTFMKEGRCRTPEGKFTIRQYMKEDPAVTTETNFFYPTSGAVRQMAAAREFCQSCAVQEECLDYALFVPEDYGVFGGESAKGRGKILAAKAKEQNETDLIETGSREVEGAGVH